MDIEAVDEYIDSVKERIQSATSAELFNTANELSQNPELRGRVEKKMRDTLPEGFTFYINELGIGVFGSSLFISRVVGE